MEVSPIRRKLCYALSLSGIRLAASVGAARTKPVDLQHVFRGIELAVLSARQH